MGTGFTKREQSAVLTLIKQMDQESLILNPKVNRRVRKRYGVRLTQEVILHTMRAMPRVMIFMRNISTRGAGFVCRRGMLVGERFVLCLYPPQLEGRLLLCRVSFCRYVGGGWREIGAEFEAVIHDPERQGKIPPPWRNAPEKGKKKASGTPA